ncbi:unnamed protein product [Closterium sp. NIES-53]
MLPQPEGAEPGGAEPASAEPGGAELDGAEPRVAETEGAEPWGADSEGAESGGAEPRGTASAEGPAGASPRLSRRREPLSLRQRREWFSRRTRLRSGTVGAGGPAAGGTGAGGARATSPGGAGVTAGAGGTGGAGAAGPGGARSRGTGAAGAGGVGGTEAGDPGAGGNGAEGAGGGGSGAGDPGAGGTVARDPGVGGTGDGGPGGTGAADPGPGGTSAGGTGARGVGAGGIGAGGAGARGAGAGGAGAGGTGAGGARVGDPRAGGAGGGGARAGGTGAGGTVQRRQFFVPPPPSSLPPPGSSRPASPVRAVRTGRRVPPPHPPPVPCTHIMALRPSSAPLQVPLLSPPASSLADGLEPESDLVPAASPSITRLLATIVTDPSFESAAVSTLVAELVDFAAARRLDYAASLVAESESDCPPSVGGECALGTDVLEDRQEDFECLAAAVPHFASMLLAPEGDPDAPDIPTPPSYAEAITGTYGDAVPPPGANIFDGMWIFRVKRPPGSPPVFKARYDARGFSQRQGVDFFHTFSPAPKMTTLWVLLHVAAQRDYELHSLDFSTAFLRGSLHEEIWLHRPPGSTWSFPACTHWSLRRPVYSLRQLPRKWHDTLRTMLAAFGLLLRLLTRRYHPGQSTAHHYPDSVTHGALGPSALRLPVLLATVYSSA